MVNWRLLWRKWNKLMRMSNLNKRKMWSSVWVIKKVRGGDLVSHGSIFLHVGVDIGTSSGIHNDASLPALNNLTHTRAGSNESTKNDEMNLVDLHVGSIALPDDNKKEQEKARRRIAYRMKKEKEAAWFQDENQPSPTLSDFFNDDKLCVVQREDEDKRHHDLQNLAPPLSVISRMVINLAMQYEDLSCIAPKKLGRYLQLDAIKY